MNLIKGRSIFLSASIDALLDRILSQRHRESSIDSLTAAQSRILFLLWQRDEISIGEVARITDLKKSTLTTTLAKLEKVGHIQLIPCETDKRKTIVKVINRNEDLIALNKSIIDEVGELFYMGFSNDEVALYESFLKRTLDNLKEFQEKHK
ncbi:MarR family winged helix-turn-helix transcriptional regulator [Clostridium saccharoperbutylacetonicum]|uniref:MarR family winged helix-turn-helix transcriptional regulator n=1 Tax=Clostridium saccharoperbutylacetonicum TaxID=36745 RepID=UPI000983CA87|nr:MarR family transcriptional regulator [Clostridium saccharoperbutylacetonicum]AQR94563.1 transcriptional regulator SlyA [Clostridium saccharoperbutylacetonicum]NSB30399.1 DNA-binding MarR family transcriptional regulator [Clostridium saccharoperbutylacetonicum]